MAGDFGFTDFKKIVSANDTPFLPPRKEWRVSEQSYLSEYVHKNIS